MTTDEMFIELEDKPRDTVIVTLKYKYDFEENYTIENQILEYDAGDDTYVWLNDWYEGQTYIEVLGYMFLGDVNTAPLPDKNETITDFADRCRECGAYQGQILAELRTKGGEQ